MSSFRSFTILKIFSDFKIWCSSTIFEYLYFFGWMDICMMKDNVDVLLWGEFSQILFKYVQMVKNNTINVENASEILRKSS